MVPSTTTIMSDNTMAAPTDLNGLLNAMLGTGLHSCPAPFMQEVAVTYMPHQGGAEQVR
jgi:hypothetical protein